MHSEAKHPARHALAVAAGTAGLVSLYALFGGRNGLQVPAGGLIAAIPAIAHIVWAAALALGSERRMSVDARRTATVAETLFFVTLFLFLFSYIFASNANMDYVQRFIEAGGRLSLAIDTRTERALAVARFGPLMVVDAAVWRAVVRPRRRAGAAGFGVWAPVLVLLSVLLSVLSQPSFASVAGWGPLGWVALVPLVVVILTDVDARRPVRAVWYGVLFGVLRTLIGNYWLGTFSLVSLQAVGVIFLGFHLVFMPLLVASLTVVRGARLRAVLIPAAWTVFELFHSSGFLGYPWLLQAHSQYRFVPLIQLAELGGVWLISTIVVLVNTLLAIALIQLGRSPRVALRWTIGAAAALAMATAVGAGLLAMPRPDRGTVRVALIQQNSDPRKHEYEYTLDSLVELTDTALQYDPDIVVWSETAFVPNIRRWSREDPQRYRLARLVRRFLAYQRSIDTWLVTGNDDYRRVLGDDGREVRRDSYNAAVLFSPSGERRETYHKIKLVPFTEHFPFEERFPRVYALLEDFDVHFWAQGSERVVFEHPAMRFSTPICFEDVFPQEVRKFAENGMEVIVNISNDYWSLQEVAAQQHFAASLFRTVELRRPLVRATASGVTAHVDAAGRIRATVPQYSRQYLIADVAIPDGSRRTMYQRWGEWIPAVAGAAWVITLGAGAVRRLRMRRRRNDT